MYAFSVQQHIFAHNCRKQVLEEAKKTLALSLVLLTTKKKTFVVLFRWDSTVLTAARTAGAASICKAALLF